VVFKQIHYMKNSDMAFDNSNLIVIPLDVEAYEDEDDALLRFETFRNELTSHTQITAVTTSTHVPSRWSGSNVFVRPEGWEGDPLRMRYTYHDANFFKTFGIEMVEGKGFRSDLEGDQRQSVVLNEAAMRAFGFDNIENKAIVIGSTKIDVVGAIGNFNYETMKEEISPILHFHRVPSNGVHQYITVRFVPENYSSVRNFIEGKWQIVSEEDPFEFFFMDDSIAEMYAAEDRMLKIVTTFSLVAIFIAGLGLFGLSSFMIEKRKKEIGIRKVLGANILQILQMVSASFGVLIIIAGMVAVPVSYYLMDEWLNGFAYAVSIDILIYVISLLTVVLAGMLAISYTAISAASANPVTAIRDD